MKSKKGFTLVELLAVIAILAILVLIALPNILNLYRNARENVFVEEVQNILRSAQQAYVTNSLTNKSKTCFDSKSNPLDIDAKSSLKYKIELSNNGKIISIQVMDNNYQLIKTNGTDIKRDDIGNSRSNKTIKSETRQEGVGLTACDGTSIEEGEEEIPEKEEYFEGSGTEDDPFKIQYIEDLIELSERVNGGESFENKVFKLMNNLDFQNEENYKDAETNKDIVTTGIGFTPIGKETTPFSATFEGDNKEISNLMINEGEEDIDVGFFGYTENSTIQNLKISGSVTSTSKDAGGIINTASNTTLNNVTNNINVTSNIDTNSVGGLIGYAKNTINIKSSSNISNIKNGNNVGGLVGSSNGNLTIDTCENNGLIAIKNGTNSGGLIGSDTASSKTIIKNSKNNKNITLSEEKRYLSGGIMGISYGDVSINDTVNNGSIIINQEEYEEDFTIYIAGIIGITSIDTNVSITNSYNTGEIKNGNRIGGIIGGNSANLILKNVYNDGNISSNVTKVGALVGGLIGYNASGPVSIMDSYNKKTISSNAYSGGLLAYAENVFNIINSYNIGNIVATDTGTGGGIIGAVATGTINGNIINVYNGGSIDSKNKCGIGANWVNKPCSVLNAYYDNSILESSTPLPATPIELSTMKSNTFVTTLNTNKNSINLTEIDSNLSGYSLCNWILGTSGYPELDCK